MGWYHRKYHPPSSQSACDLANACILAKHQGIFGQLNSLLESREMRRLILESGRDTLLLKEKKHIEEQKTWALWYFPWRGVQNLDFAQQCWAVTLLRSVVKSRFDTPTRYFRKITGTIKEPNFFVMTCYNLLFYRLPGIGDSNDEMEATCAPFNGAIHYHPI